MATGILALQGNFRDHSKSLELISKEYIYIKNSNDIENIDSLMEKAGTLVGNTNRDGMSIEEISSAISKRFWEKTCHARKL